MVTQGGRLNETFGRATLLYLGQLWCLLPSGLPWPRSRCCWLPSCISRAAPAAVVRTAIRYAARTGRVCSVIANCSRVKWPRRDKSVVVILAGPAYWRARLAGAIDNDCRPRAARGSKRVLTRDHSYISGYALRCSSAISSAAPICMSGPFPIPGQKRAVRFHSFGCSINSGQNGNVRHWVGLAG
jgi:hypothetical protein